MAHLRAMNTIGAFPFVAALCAVSLTAPVCAGAAVPRLVPARDVTIDYQVDPRGHAPVEVQVNVEGGGAHLRITSNALPTAFVVDRPAGTATILLPLLRLYATADIGRYDPQTTVLRNASFVRAGQGRVAGRACTEWNAISPQGRAQACITDDGVILRGMAADRHGPLGSVVASAVRYGALDPELFRRPPGYRNAGTLPVDGFGSMQP